MSRSGSAFDAGQRLLLERIAHGAPLESVLSELVRLVEQQAHGMGCSVLLVNSERGTVHPIAAPSLPAAYTQALEGAKIGPDEGSCGAAAYRKERVIVSDIATHPFWREYRELALPHGLRACWSTPILTAERRVLGTFAMYYGEPREPTSIELAWVDAATHVATIAILHAEYKAAERAARAVDDERRALEQRLIEAERLKGLGTLAAGIAHDFNNILTAVRGHTDLALLATRDNALARQSLEEVRAACVRANKLVRQILTFGQLEEARRGAVSLRAVIDEALGLIASTLPSSIELRTRFAPGEWPIWADETQVHQVIMNVAVNAVAAMADRPGAIEISLDHVEIGDAHRKIDLASGRYVRLRVSDQGCGMSPETLARAFDPFFTTKRPGEGTGLGLSVVHGIMKSHDGAVTVESEPGRGTTFELYFPAASALPEADARTPKASAPAPAEHVLYVDDDEALVVLMLRLLRRLGYRATGVSDAREALALLDRDPSAVDVVITDSNMPGMSGPELLREIKQRRLPVRTVLVSGYVEEAAVSSGGEEVALKPHTIDDLAQLLQSALRRHAAPTDMV